MSKWNNTPIVSENGDVANNGSESATNNQFFAHLTEYVEKNPSIVNELKQLQKDAENGNNPITRAWEWTERKHKKGGW